MNSANCEILSFIDHDEVTTVNILDKYERSK